MGRDACWRGRPRAATSRRSASRSASREATASTGAETERRSAAGRGGGARRRKASISSRATSSSVASVSRVASPRVATAMDAVRYLSYAPRQEEVLVVISRASSEVAEEVVGVLDGIARADCELRVSADPQAWSKARMNVPRATLNRWTTSEASVREAACGASVWTH